MTFKEHFAEMMQDPEFAKAYYAPDPEFDLGIMIYKARMDSGLSQKQVAEITGINQGNLSKIETGERIPSVRTLQKIASCLGVALALVPINSIPK